ncbi:MULTISPECIES: cell division protein FtsQ/DivIB [unclassified Synechococcus]|uniref:cell division protein FtsQ/DivIB n=1 Tax=unclassified Synechococcus TaxID=2626047 RepID=UPI0039AF92CE
MTRSQVNKQESNTSTPLPPGVERRRRLRQERRRERLIQIWRILLLGGVSGSLVWVLLSAGWSLRSQQQLTVRGSERLGSEAVVKAAGLRFPRPLITLEPGLLERRLQAELPVQSVSVKRRLVPPGLDIELQDRRPVAAASRMGARGKEQGMVDFEGHWMPLTVARQGEAPASAVRVDGWIPSRRSMIAAVLAQRDQLGSPLSEIHIAPDGDLSLRTQTLGLVQLGSNERLLDQQLRTIALLSSSLPENLRGKTSSGIDLSDPSKPELQLKPSPKQKTSKP